MEALRGEIEAAAATVLAPHHWSGRTTVARAIWSSSTAGAHRIRPGAEELQVRGHTAVPRALRGRPENRLVLRSECERELFRRLLWPGVRVLDLCSYSGAWAIRPALRGARSPVCRFL